MASGETSTGPRFVGRFDLCDPAGPRCAWPGSTIVARFEAEAIAIRIRGSSDFFRVWLDGNELPVLAASPETERYELARGLPAGPHEIVVTKRTEPLVSEAQILGFDPGARGRLLPPPPPAARRLEFIGDSVTAGFGVLGADASCPFSPDTEDYCLSFAALTARALGAEAVAVAWSGRGACRNYADEPGEPMPVLWERTLPSRPDSRWDVRRFVPHAVVINLGTNDFSLGVSPGERFVEAYAGLLRRVGEAYPAAWVFACLGPMLEGEVLGEARRGIERAIEEARTAGQGRIRLVEFPLHTAEEGYGCDGHPSARTHRRMAAQLVPCVADALGW